MDESDLLDKQAKKTQIAIWSDRVARYASYFQSGCRQFESATAHQLFVELKLNRN
jgi:hypothetical protein